jgi:hypothetical protein
MIKELLEEKYGKEIISDLLINGRINLSRQAVNKTKTKMVDDQMRKMIDLNLLTEADYEKGKPWAFDISSTFADLTKISKIPIMIIGEDPHVQSNDYQAVYGFAPNGIDFKKESIKDKFKKHIIRLFYSETEFQEKSDADILEFLSNFYVADICHFTPQGADKRKEELENWEKIKINTANYFLKKEIEVIKPDLIISHGKFSRENLSKILGIEIKEAGKIGQRYYEGQYGGITILGLSHLGSRNTIFHWNKSIDDTREELIKKDYWNKLLAITKNI